MSVNSSTNSLYKTLYIYYLKGRLERGTSDLGVSFIGNWEEEDTSFLFFSQNADKTVHDLLVQQPHLTLEDQYQMPYDKWQQDCGAPLVIGSFRIIPVWMGQRLTDKTLMDKTPQPDNDSGLTEIFLDPGVVFGTGTHPTTGTCLQAMQMAYDGQQPQAVLDLGTGTGILAIAAALLGSPKVLAVDFNYLSVQTALKNIRTNHVSDNVLAINGRAQDFIDTTADLMIANIHYDVMKDLVSHDRFLTFKQFILSGLLRSEAKTIEAELNRLPVRILKKWHEDGVWFTYFGETLR